ncbi:hard surface induced protein [Colletotrichum karsti]|uniref:Hard surface induced protein n=1 Tax=Colletotrichum karsti TaxID=1095194 RepID=A0A9P6IBQ9_9PEZI|nr:hard surface induced protein [Colletotrichum karsti]KAF9878891.1 hard surface induced protein [Colletotrichum karsti]
MINNVWDKSARAHRGSGGHQEEELLPRTEHNGRGSQHENYDEKSKGQNSDPRRNSRDKIRALDGLRGIACLIVFNYHFFWPWTPFIMLGSGANPPGAPEPYVGWHQLPIICLLHRGRPMVAIFFAISGFVLCRHILRAIHERRVEAAYKSLASSVLRRVFRLYIPPTISMFLVAVLAQLGAFKSETAIFKGPDSAYINGTVTFAYPQLGDSCVNGTVAAAGARGVAKQLQLQTPLTLGNLTNLTASTDQLCLNRTSHLFMPAVLYNFVDSLEAQAKHENKSANATHVVVEPTKPTSKTRPREDKTGSSTAGHLEKIWGKHKSSHEQTPKEAEAAAAAARAANFTNTHNITWVQMGGSWEEHPIIHDNMTYAIKNFTRVYAEWANPFNFAHYHTRYDPHTFTIPMELRGSMFIYLFLLGTAAVKSRWRLAIGAFLSAYSLIFGRWDMAAFVGGTVLSELDIRRASDPDEDLLGYPRKTAAGHHKTGLARSVLSSTATRWLATFVALWLLSYPDAAAEWTPGFVLLSSLVPRYYIPLSGWMFYQSMGAILLLPCVLRSPVLVRLFEGRLAQYLGRISFSLYLVHGPVLHSLGFWLMPRLFENFGRAQGYVIGWVVLMSVTLYLTNLWNKKIDGWSTTVGRRVERALLDSA